MFTLCRMSGRPARRVLAVFSLFAALAAASAASSPAAAGARWKMTDLGTLGPAWRDSSAADVNASGEIAGTSGTASGKQHAFLWRDGKVTDLGTLGGRDSSATAI